jgi:glutathione S-transferase
MTQLPMILHHYEASPYAEKIRLMFGMAGADWQSVLSPPQPPRPNVDPLTGGYRRIPVAQSGADIFCDTSLIAAEVAAMTDQQALRPQFADETARMLANKAEGDMFFAAITSVPPAKLLGTLLSNFGLLGTLRFMKDRSGMMRSATIKPLQGKAAATAFAAFQTELNAHLAERPFIAGRNVSYADLCVFHPLWLQCRVGRRPLPSQHTHLEQWFARIDSFGHGDRQDITAEAAFAAARAADPRPLPETMDPDQRLGTRVSVAPADYGRNPVTGELVALTDERVVVARQTEAFGKLHVHFPRDGYEVHPA